MVEAEQEQEQEQEQEEAEAARHPMERMSACLGQMGCL